jgi:hypothetical protein
MYDLQLGRHLMTPQICGEDLAAIGKTMRNFIMIIYMMIHDVSSKMMMTLSIFEQQLPDNQIKSTGKEVVVRTPKLGQNSAGERGASSFSWRKKH